MSTTIRRMWFRVLNPLENLLIEQINLLVQKSNLISNRHGCEVLRSIGKWYKASK